MLLEYWNSSILTWPASCRSAAIDFSSSLQKLGLLDTWLLKSRGETSTTSLPMSLALESWSMRFWPLKLPGHPKTWTVTGAIPIDPYHPAFPPNCAKFWNNAWMKRVPNVRTWTASVACSKPKSIQTHPNRMKGLKEPRKNWHQCPFWRIQKNTILCHRHHHFWTWHR